MMAEGRKSVRCAVYTRVSTEAGLDQDFNSLDAQYDAAQAYIRSQAHAGWTLIHHRYDDGGFSGGSTDRPALQRLIADINAHKINVVVVYKVDRLTRSLADFAKLVELLDGPPDAQRAAVVCAIRARGHRRAHPRQDRCLQAQRAVGRRNGAAWLRTQGWQTSDRRGRSGAGSNNLQAIPGARKRQPTGDRSA